MVESLTGSGPGELEQQPDLAAISSAPERTRTSTAYKGHKALNRVTEGLELTYVSICRDVSAVNDRTDVYREAFVITAVITPNNPVCREG
jgi:hypothetical protein